MCHVVGNELAASAKVGQAGIKICVKRCVTKWGYTFNAEKSYQLNFRDVCRDFQPYKSILPEKFRRE